MLFKCFLLLICILCLQGYLCLYKKEKSFYLKIKNKRYSKNKNTCNKVIKRYFYFLVRGLPVLSPIKNYRKPEFLYINKIITGIVKEKIRKVFLNKQCKENGIFKPRTHIILHYKKKDANMFNLINENNLNEEKNLQKKTDENKKCEDKEYKGELHKLDINFRKCKDQNKKKEIKKEIKDFMNAKNINKNEDIISDKKEEKKKKKKENYEQKLKEKKDEKKKKKNNPGEKMIENEDEKKMEGKMEQENKIGDVNNLSKSITYERSKDDNSVIDTYFSNSKYPIDYFVNQHRDILLKSKSNIMKMSSLNRNKNINNEASIDDILYGGFLNIYKPVNLYSMKVCEKVKNVLKNYFFTLNEKNINLKVGHGGTLDPFAEGVLIIGIQKATKKLSDFLTCYKKYLALSIFGYETDTLDREGKIVKEKKMHVYKKDIFQNLKKFIGWNEQTPPIYSAKRVKGLRLYEYARKNIPVQIKSNKVHIKNIKYLNEFDFPFFDLQVHCSGGTYIRSLIRDFAHSLNTYATLIKLVRIEQNQFKSIDALHYDNINMQNIKKYYIKL